MAEELERLEKAEAERERLEKLKASDPEAYEREVNPTKAVNKGLEGLKSDSRRGSLIPGGSRRGSLIPGRSRQGSIALGGPDRATVAMITDDPENKKNLKVALAGAFEDSAIRDLLGDLPANASEEEIASRLAAAGITGDAAKQMMSAVKSGGGGARLLVETGGSFKVTNLEETSERIDNAFDKAIADHEEKMKKLAKQNEKDDELSAETRKLMEQILASSGDKDETSARVAALLAGSSLTTTRGAKRGDGREVDMVQYEGTNMEDMKERKDTFEMPEVPNVNIPQLRDGGLTNGHGLSNGLSNGVTMRDHSGGAGGIKRGSIKRQSEIMREKKMSRQEEREEERKRKESYFRKVTGLRKAKVPLMVYSCGGFSRCFRIARFYDLEGPPVGVEYSKPEDDRRALNPEL